MARSISILILISMVSCTPRSVERTTAPEIRTTLQMAMTECIPGDDGLTRCPTGVFQNLGLACIGCGRDLQDCRDETEALRQTGALDIEIERLKAAELQAKLDSPWRSWWLWSTVGGVVSAVVCTAVYWGD